MATSDKLPKSWKNRFPIFKVDPKAFEALANDLC